MGKKHKHKASPRCKNVARYRGFKRPRCHGGYGCYTCWAKWFSMLEDTWE